MNIESWPPWCIFHTYELFNTDPPEKNSQKRRNYREPFSQRMSRVAVDRHAGEDAQAGGGELPQEEGEEEEQAEDEEVVVVVVAEQQQRRRRRNG